MGSEEDYEWLTTQAARWLQWKAEEENAPHPMATITAVAGRLARPEPHAANDHPEARLFLCLFLLGICAKYLANLRTFAQIRAKYHQNPAPHFFSPKSPETRTLQSFQETQAKFLTLLTLCQMNSSPTASRTCRIAA